MLNKYPELILMRFISSLLLGVKSILPQILPQAMASGVFSCQKRGVITPQDTQCILTVWPTQPPAKIHLNPQLDDLVLWHPVSA